MTPRPKNPDSRSLKVYIRDKDGIMKAIPGLIASEFKDKIVKVYRLTPGNFDVNDPNHIQEIDLT
jgi:hypothetical protein